MAWDVELSKEAEREFLELRDRDPRLALRIEKRIDRLETTFFPPGATKLEPKSENRYRIRVGGYRIVYRAFKAEKRILVTVIEKRGQAGLY
jgi:mRNA-degrading endonuclease RelE of RelBE toxin-antitoxin system